MDRSSRSELLKTIEAQNEKITKYERKLRDLVGAYKGLLKEKEALEASVKALSGAAQAAAAAQAASLSSKETSGSHESLNRDQAPSAFEDPLNVNGSNAQSEDRSEVKDGEEAIEGGEDGEGGGSGAEVRELRTQLATLSASLATVMQEKSKMEASYQADKRQLRQEHEEAESRHQQLEREQQTSIEQLMEELQEWRAKLRSQQHEHEKQQDDHAMMLRELQKLLAQERIAKEQLEQQLDESKQALLEQQTSADVSAQYEDRLRELGRELGAVREQLAAEQERARGPSKQVEELQGQLVRVRADQGRALQQEQARAASLEERLKSLGTQHEQHVAGLEAKLAELSDTAGQYERLRCQDQASIQALRERLTQLDLENTALAKAAHTSPGSGAKARSPGLREVEEGAEIQEIVEQIMRLKGQLKTANEKLDKPVNIEELLQIDAQSVMDEETLHAQCRADLSQLREEFERYKLRAQSVLKNKSTKELMTSSKEVEGLKQQVAELKERVRHMHVTQEELEAKLGERETHYREALTALSDQHRVEVANTQAAHQQRLAELELEMRRHRDRTIALLAEKDRELERLRGQSPLEQPYMGPYARQTSQSSSVDIQEAGASSEEGASVAELLARTSLSPGGGGSGEQTVLYFAQEQARREVEVAGLRRQKHALEQSLREAQQGAALSQQAHAEAVERLQEQVHALQRNQSRESANLEYLKNVVYHYMVCHDATGKQQMSNAIATILEFSPRERQSVHAELSKGWWTYGQTSPSK